MPSGSPAANSSNDAKHQILAALRRQTPEDVALPSLAEAWIQYDDPHAVFAEVLASVGGVCVRVADRAELVQRLEESDAYREARRTCVTVPGLELGNVALAQVEDPHALADVDYALVRGEFAVAENGAVWISDRDLRHRAILFLPQQLALVVPAREVLSNMHQAYARIAFAEPGFGVFLSGPSKTADIEQSLVVGAHGAKSLHVFLMDRD